MEPKNFFSSDSASRWVTDTEKRAESFVARVSVEVLGASC